MARVVHFELTGPDPERLIEFYGRSFGWEFGRMEGLPDYWYVRTGEPETPGINGGLSRGEPVRAVTCCIDVPNLDDALRAVVQNGGRPLQERMAVPCIGWYATFEDPAGNQLGLMEEDPGAGT